MNKNPDSNNCNNDKHEPKKSEGCGAHGCGRCPSHDLQIEISETAETSWKHQLATITSQAVRNLLSGNPGEFLDEIDPEAAKFGDHAKNLALSRVQIHEYEEVPLDKTDVDAIIVRNGSITIKQLLVLSMFTHSKQSTSLAKVTIEMEFAGQYTLAIIKPDAYKDADGVIKMMEDAGLQIATMDGRLLKMTKRMTHEEAAQFYAEHSARACFGEMCEFMSSGDCMILVLCGVDAVKRYRQIMGATDPVKAEAGTIRTMFGGKHIGSNAVHGSDSPENAMREINQFFPDLFSIKPFQLSIDEEPTHSASF